MQTKTLSPIGTKLVAVKSFEDIRVGDIGTIDEITESNKYLVRFLDNLGKRRNDWYLGSDLTFNKGANEFGVCMEVYQESVTEITIQTPDGMVIDEENSTFSKIKFKLKEKCYPKTWNELKCIKGYFVESNSRITKAFADSSTGKGPCCSENKSIFTTKEQAKASIALAQLTQLVEVYNEGWKPDWRDLNQSKFIIEVLSGLFEVDEYSSNCTLLAFKEDYLAKLFLQNFKDLIKEASPLLFGYTFKD